MSFSRRVDFSRYLWSSSAMLEFVFRKSVISPESLIFSLVISETSSLNRLQASSLVWMTVFILKDFSSTILSDFSKRTFSCVAFPNLTLSSAFSSTREMNSISFETSCFCGGVRRSILGTFAFVGDLRGDFAFVLSGDSGLSLRKLSGDLKTALLLLLSLKSLSVSDRKAFSFPSSISFCVLTLKYCCRTSSQVSFSSTIWFSRFVMVTCASASWPFLWSSSSSKSSFASLASVNSFSALCNFLLSSCICLINASLDLPPKSSFTSFPMLLLPFWPSPTTGCFCPLLCGDDASNVFSLLGLAQGERRLRASFVIMISSSLSSMFASESVGSCSSEISSSLAISSACSGISV